MNKKFSHLIYLSQVILLICSPLYAQYLKVDPTLPAYFLKKNDQLIRTVVQHGGFRSGDIIADIGAGDGLFDACISIYTDSITFFLEDIDSNAFIPNKFERAVQFYSSVKKRKITNVFINALGNEKTTELQSGYFDKALVIDSYHHFSYRNEMTDDINRILKSGAELFIYDVLARRKGDEHPVCHTPIYTTQELLDHIQSRGFVIKEILKLKKAARRKARLFVFRKL